MNAGEETVPGASPVTTKLSLRNKLYIKIDDSLAKKEVRNLRALLDDRLGRARLEKATPLEICRMLEDEDEIGAGRLELLIELLKDLKRTKLAREALEIQEKEGRVLLQGRKRIAAEGIDNVPAGKVSKLDSTDHGITSDERERLPTRRERTSSVDSDEIEDFPDITFQGRQDELDRIKKNFQDGFKVGLISGLPGVGKSRLAKEAALHTSMECQERNIGFKRHHLDARNFKSTNLIIDTVFASLLAGDYAGMIWTPESLIAAVKKVKKVEDCHLFICDNADTILEDGELQSQLLDVICKIVRVSSMVFFLVTSSRKFRLAKERNVFFDIHVPPLYHDEASALLTTIAPEVPPNLASEIVTLCGRLPLALTLAGNELQGGEEEGYTPEELIELIRNDVLESPLSDDSYSKSERVGHVLGSAVNRLTEVLKKHYAELNYIPGSFSTAAAAAVTGKESTAVAKAHTLRPLRQRSLLEFDDSEGRWDIHPLLRNLLPISPSHVDVGVTRRRYCVFFADILKQIGEGMREDAPRSLRNLTNDFQNIEKMMLEAINCADDDSYRAFFGAVSEGEGVMNQYIPSPAIVPFYQACLNSAMVQGTPEEKAKMLIVLGYVKGNHLGQYQEAFDNYEQAKALLEPIGISTTLARLYSNMGSVYHSRGDYKTAIRYLNDALEMWDRLRHGPSIGKSFTLATLGMVHGFFGNLREAKEYHTRCLEMRIEMFGKNHPMIGPTQNNLAIIYDRMGDLEEALDLHLSALGLKRRWFNRPNQSLVNSLNGVAIQFMFQKEYDKALQYLQEAEKMQQEIAGSGRHSVYTTLNLGKVFVYMEQYEQAEMHLKMASEWYEEQRGSNIITAEAFEFLGMALHGLGRHDEAKEAVAKSLAMYENESANVNVNKDIPRLRALLDKVNHCRDKGVLVQSNMATISSVNENPLMAAGNNQNMDSAVNDAEADPKTDVSKALQSTFCVVAEETGYRWRDLARRLGLTEVQIQDAASKHQGRLTDSCIDALEAWQKKPGPKVMTTKMLQDALLDCGLKAIAETIGATEEQKVEIINHKRKLSAVFYNVAEDTGPKWKDLARKLSLKPAQIDGIETRHHREIKECCMDVLETWRLGEGGAATIQALQQALREADLGALADEMCYDIQGH
ncbi:uncharacterized protein LOC144883319 [Branchiostoma floridae x Branchiostoma japonicum]